MIDARWLLFRCPGLACHSLCVPIDCRPLDLPHTRLQSGLHCAPIRLDGPRSPPRLGRVTLRRRSPPRITYAVADTTLSMWCVEGCSATSPRWCGRRLPDRLTPKRRKRRKVPQNRGVLRIVRNARSGKRRESLMVSRLPRRITARSTWPRRPPPAGPSPVVDDNPSGQASQTCLSPAGAVASAPHCRDIP